MSMPVVLIVDDEPAGRQALEALLGGQGFDLVFADDGPDALAKAATTLPDVILLDVMMPGMDGFEVCQRLRTDLSLAEVPIVMVTALDDQASRLRGLEAGADDFISKPFNRAELRARVRTITRLNRYRSLLNERQKFVWMAEQSPDGYVLVNERDDVLYANPNARLYLHLEPGDEAMRQAFLSLAQRFYLCEPDEAWRNWPAQTELELARARYLVRPETAGATAMWLLVTLYPSTLSAETQRLIRLRDVTAQMSTHRDMRTFHATIQHKLRTPLATVIQGLELLTHPGLHHTEAERQEMIESALRGSHRLHEAIKDILRYVKGASLINPETPFAWKDLPALVERLRADLDSASITVQVADELCAAKTVLAEQSVEWILWELLENAHKFHPQHRPTIMVSLAPAGAGWCSLRVSDDGVSLTPEQLAHVWEPYYQGEKFFSGEMKGMGLGLPTVAVLTWQVGGACQLRNRMPGPGVEAEITLPLAH